MEQRSQIPQDEALSLCRLPTDILRKILTKLALKDRLRLELVDKKHRDTLREPELWYEIDLATMQALDLTADQLLHLLSRVYPDFERVSSQVQSMAEILLAVSGSFTKNGINFWTRHVDVEIPIYYGKDVVSIAARLLGRLHHQVPESWGATRYLVEACTIWFSDQVQRLLTVGPWMRGLWVASLKTIRDPNHFLKKLEARLDTLRNPDRQCQLKTKSKVDVSLDVSGAGNLAPAFLAACIVALAAAGFKVSFRMTGNGDPSFPAYDLLNLLRTLALDCSICVNVGVSGTYLPMTPLLEAATQLGEEDTASATSTVDVASLADRIAVAYKSEYKGSEAAYRRFVTQIRRLIELQGQIEVEAGRSKGCQEKGAKAKFACEAVVFENLFGVAPTLLDEFYQYLHDPPSNLRLVFRNCLLTTPEDFRSLGELLRCDLPDFPADRAFARSEKEVESPNSERGISPKICDTTGQPLSPASGPGSPPLPARCRHGHQLPGCEQARCNQGDKTPLRSLVLSSAPSDDQLQPFNGSDCTTQCLMFNLCKDTRLIESLQ
jgi:hypothetical protein